MKLGTTMLWRSCCSCRRTWADKPYLLVERRWWLECGISRVRWMRIHYS